MDFDTMMKKVGNIESLHAGGLITEDQATDYKARIIRSFEDTEIPERLLPNDIGHLPGRMIEGLVHLGQAIARGSGETYRRLEEQEMKKSGPKKSVIDLYNDIK